MTKRELEIRLEIAERVIEDSLYCLSEENVEKIMKKYGWDRDGATFGSIGETKFTLRHYSERADSAVERDSKDIYKR